MEEGMSKEEAVTKANKTLINWEEINEDAKELHYLLNTFSF